METPSHSWKNISQEVLYTWPLSPGCLKEYLHNEFKRQLCELNFITHWTLKPIDSHGNTC